MTRPNSFTELQPRSRSWIIVTIEHSKMIHNGTGSALEKYLRLYAEPETHQLKQQLLQQSNQPSFQQGIIIPVYREDTSVVDRFARFAKKNPGTLIIMVVNRPDTDNDITWATKFFSNPHLDDKYLRWQSTQKSFSLYSLDHNSNLLIADRCLNGSPIPTNQGVGLARKIGADILCQLINCAAVKSPWIYNTDADAHLPIDYFSTLKNIHHTAATVYPFEHVFTQNSNQNTDQNSLYQLSTLLYEFSLYYYVNGLSWAASPYAFHTIASTIAIHYEHYAKVRGFPKRAAAEDFYLLNKTAKTGKIVTLDQPTIQLQSRVSNRVPFGTGPAVSKLIANNEPLKMPLYHPDSFLYLRFFLQLLTQLAADKTTISTAADHLIAENHITISLEVLVKILDHLKFSPALAHCYKHGKNKANRLQHLHHWFDGFKTLKFIHLLRDTHLPMINFQHWLESSDRYSLPTNTAMNTLIQRINAIR